MFQKGSGWGSTDGGDQEDQPQNLTELLDTEPKFRAYEAPSESVSTLDRPVDRHIAMFDMPQPAHTFDKPEEYWGYTPSDEPSLSSGDVSKPKVKNLTQELSLKSLSLGRPGEKPPTEEVPLPRKPIYMEKYTTISSTSQPESLLKCITDHFDNAEIDFEFVKEVSKIKALCGNQGRRCKFNVRLFRGDGEGEVLVEFQRRCGDIIAFTSLYRNVLESLGKADLIKGSKKPASTAPPAEKPSAMPDLAELSLEELSLDAAAVQSLYEMAECELVDVQKEGLSALASVSVDSKANQAKLVGSQERVIRILESVLDSEDEEINHTGAVLLANVTTQPQIHQNVTEKLTSKIVSLMGSRVTLGNKDTKRYLARALLNLSNPNNIGELKKQKEFAAVKEVLDACRKLEDKILSDIIGQIDPLLA